MVEQPVMEMLLMVAFFAVVHTILRGFGDAAKSAGHPEPLHTLGSQNVAFSTVRLNVAAQPFTKVPLDT